MSAIHETHYSEELRGHVTKNNDVCRFDAAKFEIFVQRLAAGYKRVKSSVFNHHLNAGSDGDDETRGGKLFQTRAAATGNAWSPIVRTAIVE